MKTTDYIDMARKFTETRSDYAVAALLGISEDAVNYYRKGKRVMDNNTALRLSELLQVPLLEIIAHAEIERAKDTETKKKWTARLKTLGTASALIGVLTAAVVPRDTHAKDLMSNAGQEPTSAWASGDNLTIMRHFRRTVRRLAAMGAAQLTAWRLWALLPRLALQEHPAL